MTGDRHDPAHLRLGLNIDHVATVRNARGGAYPDPVRAARLAESIGVDGITAHLREDRRHIRDDDIARLMAEISLPLNFEMAATEEMLAIVLKYRPHAACIVPEKRAELTTEGGLDVAGQMDALRDPVARLLDAGIRVSLFIDPDARQIEAAKALAAPVVELHTGTFCEKATHGDVQGRARELLRLREAASLGAGLGIEIHAGHGIDYDTVGEIAAIPEMRELNIGHFLIGEAIFTGLEDAVARMRQLMDEARGPAILAGVGA
ncbi:MAG: pyridoxine 5'-phosphate synthase [Parvibaculaceae bacterium]|nr:pyridoxine 5'-phosphate synthase [Parvibaculaceae bacterium]